MALIELPPVPPSATGEVSKNNSSLLVYPDPPSTILEIPVTAPPETTISAVAPSHIAVEGLALLLNNFTL